jgi:hypothetical protein
MIDENEQNLGRALGGLARAQSTSGARLSEIGLDGANARWKATGEIAKSTGSITIGDIEIPCAVMEDGTRLLSERAVTKAFGGKRGGSHWKRLKEAGDIGTNLPVFLSAKNLNEFIDDDLREGMTRRRTYRAKNGVADSHGLEATMFPKMCNTFLKARDTEGGLHPSQVAIAKQADIIMRGLAEVGIIALVDEATGHDKEKRKNEYRELFMEFVRAECRGWEQEFPPQLFDIMYKLYGIPKGKNGKHPQFFGKFIRKYIYAPLANSNGAVLEHLDAANPVVYANGGRRYKMHQFLSDMVGVPAFRAHLWQVVGIGAASKGKTIFDRNFSEAFPLSGQQIELIKDE